MNTVLTQQLQRYITDKHTQGLHRVRAAPIDTAVLDFSCNDYLSLTRDKRLQHAYQTGFQHHPAGSGGSMVLSGYHATHQQLEQAFAHALGVDDSLLFSSGYVANLAVVSLLAQFGTRLIIDKAVHASIYDGLALSKAIYTRFLHNDLDSLQQGLVASGPGAMVLTESVFSMSGQQAPLADMASLAHAYGSGLIVDEAHGFGVLGEQGMGGTIAAGLSQEQVPLRVIPFGKALGGAGAVVAGQAIWIDALLQATRQPIYSTAMSPAMAYGMAEALHLVREADERRHVLAARIAYFRQKIACSSLQWRQSLSPIQQLQLGCPYQATHTAKTLADNGIRCFAIRQPTVSKQESGLRVILNYHHTLEDIDRLFEVLHA